MTVVEAIQAVCQRRDLYADEMIAVMRLWVVYSVALQVDY